VFLNDGSAGREIYYGAQRDFYRKYNWPGKPKLVQALKGIAGADLSAPSGDSASSQESAGCTIA